MQRMWEGQKGEMRAPREGWDCVGAVTIVGMRKVACRWKVQGILFLYYRAGAPCSWVIVVCVFITLPFLVFQVHVGLTRGYQALVSNGLHVSC